MNKYIEALDYLKKHLDSKQDIEKVEVLQGLVDKSTLLKSKKEYEWIPIEERLPKQYTYVLVTCVNGEVDYGFYYDGIWVLDIIDSESYPVIAWQQLPEPYKGE